MLNQMHIQKANILQPNDPTQEEPELAACPVRIYQVTSRPSLSTGPRSPPSHRTFPLSLRSFPLRTSRSPLSFRRLCTETAHAPPPPRAPRWQPDGPSKGPCGRFLLGLGCYGITPALNLEALLPQGEGELLPGLPLLGMAD